MSDPVDISILREFIPPNALSEENLRVLSHKARIQKLGQGEILFREGDVDKETWFLMAGEVELLKGRKVVSAITVGGEDARYPLAPEQPRAYTARTATEAECLVVDGRTLDIMLTWDQEAAGYEVVELGEGKDSGDWMLRLLEQESFQRIPPANIHRLLESLEPVRVSAGDVVIKQGDPGDYFYVVKQGRCRVIRETPRKPEGVVLNHLGPGDGFGQDALISGGPRTATIVMETDGELMRLNKDDFHELLQAPVLASVNLEQAKELTREGALWLDVRLPSEFANRHLRGSVNIPLVTLRLQLPKLDKSARYIVCCDTGRRSAAAVYVMIENGFDAYLLEGGLNATPLGGGRVQAGGER
jgi:CRP-like cAMP-binding protein